MRKALIYILLLLCSLTAFAQVDTASVPVADTVAVKPQGGIIAMKGVFLQPRTQRDSVLIGDQLMYGVELRLVEEGTDFAFPQWQNDPRGGITAVSPWLIDTLKVTKRRKGMPRLLDIRAGLVITSFDEGLYDLPQIVLQRRTGNGIVDTLYYEPVRVEFKTMPVDTATFVPHDIKGQIRYPVTVAEVLPWAIAGQWVIVLIILGICLYIMFRKKGEIFVRPKEPALRVAVFCFLVPLCQKSLFRELFPDEKYRQQHIVQVKTH